MNLSSLGLSLSLILLWNKVRKSALNKGISTQYDDDPDGDAWAPLEADVTLYNHNWFWSPANEKKRRSVDELMDSYYKSVGYGGVHLLNSTSDTTGLIPEDDMKLYTEFEKEISRRFDNPLYILQHSTGISTILKVEMTSDNAVFQNKGEIRIREREQEINK